MSEKKLRDAAPLIKVLNIVNYAPVVANYAELNNKAKLISFARAFRVLSTIIL